MAPKARDEIMVRDSIEAKGDEDVDMEDATANTNGDGEQASTTPNATTQVDDASVDADGDADDADADADANGEAEEEEIRETKRGGRRKGPDTPQRRLLELIDNVSKYLCAYEEK